MIARMSASFAVGSGFIGNAPMEFEHDTDLPDLPRVRIRLAYDPKHVLVDVSWESADPFDMARERGVRDALAMRIEDALWSLQRCRIARASLSDNLPELLLASLPPAPVGGPVIGGGHGVAAAAIGAGQGCVAWPIPGAFSEQCVTAMQTGLLRHREEASAFRAVMNIEPASTRFLLLYGLLMMRCGDNQKNVDDVIRRHVPTVVQATRTYTPTGAKHPKTVKDETEFTLVRNAFAHPSGVSLTAAEARDRAERLAHDLAEVVRAELLPPATAESPGGRTS